MSAQPMSSWLATAAFLAYAIAWFLAVRYATHQVWDGWAARLATMAGLALGLFPWRHWLRPRIAVVLSWLGYAAMVACYCTLVLPFAVLMAVTGGRRAWRGPATGTRWVARRPVVWSLAVARQES